MEKIPADVFVRAFGEPPVHKEITGGISKRGYLNRDSIMAIELILKQGNDVEIRTKKDGIQIMEVKKSTKYST